MSEYEVILKPSAVEDLDKLRRYDAAMISDGIQLFLCRTPIRESKSRVKRLRGVHKADYRLRMGEYRVFYTVDRQKRTVNVLRILHKSETQKY